VLFEGILSREVRGEILHKRLTRRIERILDASAFKLDDEEERMMRALDHHIAPRD
jgi:hypothetical protein